MTIPPPCLLSLHILFSAGLLLPLFLPQDTVNAFSDFLRFFHFLFQCKIPLIERFPLDGQLGIFFFPCLCRKSVHRAIATEWARFRKENPPLRAMVNGWLARKSTRNTRSHIVSAAWNLNPPFNTIAAESQRLFIVLALIPAPELMFLEQSMSAVCAISICAISIYAGA